MRTVFTVMFVALIAAALPVCGGPDDVVGDADADADTDGDSGVVDEDGDGFGRDDDCDDADGDINPEADEICDEVDNDCDGLVDDEDDEIIGGSTFYPDEDGDGYGADVTGTVACVAPDGYVENSDDCDDTAPAFHPGAPEDDCTDPNDYNCDGSTGYADADGDGFAACEDCDDEDPDVNADGVEVCDGADNDCDGEIDEDDAVDAPTWYADADGDGAGDDDEAVVACDPPEGYVEAGGDCDDTDPRFHPGAEEDDCTDPNDYNCDGSTGYADADGDGFAACEDCDDEDPDVNADGVEVCDGADNDCDGEIDEDDAVDAPTWYADADGDGFGDRDETTTACDVPADWVTEAAGADCDDSNPAVNPEAEEVCDGADNDCDGEIDEDDALDAPTWYADVDGDGFGDPEAPVSACVAPEGTVADSSDCDDSDPEIYPEADEVCDGADNDCDGEIDEDDALDAPTWYADADGDGFGDPEAPVAACVAPESTTDDSSDCDDTDAGVNPGAGEVCDGVDHDCDGSPWNGVIGDGRGCPAQSCADLLERRPEAEDGPYYVDPDGEGAIEVLCDMTIDGGGWTQMTADYLAGLPAGEDREYLYTYRGAWYRSPVTTHIWSWSSYVALEGEYFYGSAGSVEATGSFACTHREGGYWGIGCSNGPGHRWKCLPWGSSHDVAAGTAQVCQDEPDVFRVGACARPVQIWVRP